MASYGHVTNSNKYINSLHPAIRQVVSKGIYYVNHELLIGNAKVYLVDGYRSEKQQQDKYDQSTKQGGQKVTNARAGESYHNYGLAFDVGLFVTDDPGAGRKYITNSRVYLNDDYDDDGNADFREFMVYFRDRLGFRWGGQFKSFYDPSHFEVKVNIKDLRAAYKAGNTFIDNGIKYVKLSYLVNNGYTVSLPYGANLNVENNIGDV